MKKMRSIKVVSLLFILLQSLTLFGQRISVSGIEFRVNGGRIWLNGTNTPWDKWNDFGGGFNYNWWDNEFQELSDLNINCTRVWITCDGNNTGINISNDGCISGVNTLFWSHVDQLMEIAESEQIYVMIALISFDHTKPGNPNASKWIKMYNSADNRQSFVDNYAVPFVNRYKNNPYFFAVDVGNELEWVWENHGVPSDSVIDLISRVADGVKTNSEVLVCQGWGAGIKYNTSARGGNGNYLANVNVDFYNIHYYDWQNQWFGNPFDLSPSNYNINSKPCIIGETPAKGAAGYTAQQCYQKAFEKGWQGLMAWTSNGVDDNGDKWDSKPGTDWIYDNYPNFVDVENVQHNYMNPDFKLSQNYPNPFNNSTTIYFYIPKSTFVDLTIYDVLGKKMATIINEQLRTGTYNAKYESSDLPSGLFFYRLETPEFIETKKLIIQK